MHRLKFALIMSSILCGKLLWCQFTKRSMAPASVFPCIFHSFILHTPQKCSVFLVFFVPCNLHSLHFLRPYIVQLYLRQFNVCISNYWNQDTTASSDEKSRKNFFCERVLPPWNSLNIMLLLLDEWKDMIWLIIYMLVRVM